MMTSSKAAILVSILGLLAFIAYALIVSRYVLEELTPGITAALIETLIVLAIVGGWVWGLLSASADNNIGWIVLLICSLLPTLFTLYDLALYSPIPYGWPLLQIVVWVTSVTNAAACIVVVVQIRS